MGVGVRVRFRVRVTVRVRIRVRVRNSNLNARRFSVFPVYLSNPNQAWPGCEGLRVGRAREELHVEPVEVRAAGALRAPPQLLLHALGLGLGFGLGLGLRVRVRVRVYG